MEVTHSSREILWAIRDIALFEAINMDETKQGENVERKKKASKNWIPHIRSKQRKMESYKKLREESQEVEEPRFQELVISYTKCSKEIKWNKEKKESFGFVTKKVMYTHACEHAQ